MPGRSMSSSSTSGRTESASAKASSAVAASATSSTPPPSMAWRTAARTSAWSSTSITRIAVMGAAAMPGRPARSATRRRQRSTESSGASHGPSNDGSGPSVGSHSGTSSGTDTSMVVPPWGSDVTRSVPPSSRARSSMPWSPRPRSLAVCGSKPRPLSVMAMVMSRPWMSALTRITVASACLRTFVSASWTMRSSSICWRGGNAVGSPGAAENVTRSPDRWPKSSTVRVSISDSGRSASRLVRIVTSAWRASTIAASSAWPTSPASGRSSIGHRRREPLELELREPEMLGEAVVDLAGEPRAFLQRRPLRLRDAQSVERRVGLPQRPQVRPLLGADAQQQHAVGQQAHQVGRRSRGPCRPSDRRPPGAPRRP